ncbi:MAG: rod shape-determining protein MreC [Parcubacteria bacterium OLB19]|nr:MAG: rod shape-determining protein MreC [Parcubacteria bacterium OLB19]
MVVLYPFHATTAWVKNSDGVFPTYLRSRAELVNELETLRAELVTETGTQLSIDRLLEENMQLRALANVSSSSDRLVARVIARPNSLAYDLMQIDRGSDHGVSVGVPVYSGLDSVIGVVAEVSSKYAFVELFTTPGFESTAYVIGPNVFSTLEGMGGGVARVKLPQGVPLTVGQLVLLPGVSNGVYGEIISVENHPTQPEQYGYVTPPTAMNSIFYVSIDIEAVEPKTEYDIEETIKNAIRQKMLMSDTTIESISAKIKAELATTTASSTPADEISSTTATGTINQ